MVSLGEMAGHHDSSISQPGSFNPYLEGMSYPGQYGLYPHHFSKLRGPHDLNGAYGDYPSKPQQAVPTYKWMQVKRNVPKPGKRYCRQHTFSNNICSPDGKVIAIQFFVNQKIIITYKSNSSVLHYFDFPIA